MKAYQNILVPVDGSDHSRQALQHAIDIAKITGASITLLSVANMAEVINQFSQIENTSELTMDEISESAKAQSTDILKKFAALVPASLTMKSVFELGAPEVSILEEQKALPADLICMGRGGNQPLKNFLLGSVSTYVVTHAPCPILLARDEKKGPYRHILVPVDGSESSLQALEQAETLAKGDGASLTVLYVASISDSLHDTKVPDTMAPQKLQELAEHMKTKGQNAFLRCKKQLSSDVPLQCLYRIGSPGPVILQTAAEADADLIVMGSRGLGRIQSVLLGSVGRYVSSHSGLPVLICR
ncbi:universal stress protein [Megasphaera sp.]|uniref:universal stress protein n=1 Tax=Megasphaera sp. TaxID=2023260 RepID=UPI0025FFA2C8|nr:universal stress protein [uncultured Megasphaera sp.]